MKTTLFLFFSIVLLLGCSKDKFNNNNPFLPNYAFSIDLNTSLPSYTNLKYAGNSIKAYPTNGPAKGIIVFNTGSSIVAYDGSCPNQNITSCSGLSIGGSNASCPCGNENYSLFTGQAPGKEYPLKPYRVDVNGDVIRVYN
ncbi:Rieske (2Fe-2S) protein [Flavobacterium aciduliphilum]|uniref:Nitrite reductase/ring-hydroxylating ferredoxin subunit n=1 Tax=Flavobacterium aciduliphilum TaxID=1101402 RepID=A0A328YCH2_9FLAO|nr:hypothetical protein [Flavobacterium aciduliphilum]RAR71731.1 nitrite reductase/ring-hydroxylating ferredoxin subunit [Flavobacterium aciduliphilum]